MTVHERIIRSGYEAWNRGDWAAMAQVLGPDLEIDATDRVLNPDTYSGLEGFRRLASEMAEVWASWEIEPLELAEHGDRVFVAHRVRARGKGSGVEVVRTFWSVWTVRNGRATRLALFVDRGRALAAAGLPDTA